MLVFPVCLHTFSLLYSSSPSVLHQPASEHYHYQHQCQQDGLTSDVYTCSVRHHMIHNFSYAIPTYFMIRLNYCFIVNEFIPLIWNIISQNNLHIHSKTPLHTCTCGHTRLKLRILVNFFFSWRYNPRWGLYFTAL